MSKTDATTPTRSTNHLPEPTAPDYAVPYSQEAWERLEQLVSGVLGSQKSNATSDATAEMVQQNVIYNLDEKIKI